MADVPIAGPGGIVRVPEGNLTEDELSAIGQHHNAISRFLADPVEGVQRVREFEGMVIAGVPLVTDLNRIEELDDEGRLDFGAFYEP